MALPVDFQDDILSEAMGGQRRYTLTTNDDGTVSLTDASTYDQQGSTFGAAQVNDTNAAVNAAYGMMSDEFSSTVDYVTGGYVIYENALYKFTADHAAGEWLGTDVIQVLIGEVISELNENLTAGSTPFRFGVDADGNYGYIITDSETGADTVVPFKSGDTDIYYGMTSTCVANNNSRGTSTSVTHTATVDGYYLAITIGAGDYNRGFSQSSSTNGDLIGSLTVSTVHTGNNSSPVVACRYLLCHLAVGQTVTAAISANDTSSVRAFVIRLT